jgi:hypothetical protein
MRYPYVEIEHTATRGKCRVNLWLASDDLETVFKGQTTQSNLKDALQPILDRYPKIRVSTPPVRDGQPYMHIFRINNKDKQAVSAFVKTHNECANPFRNRKQYAMVSGGRTVGFDSITL